MAEKSKKEGKAHSRREFIKIGGAVAAGLTFTGLSPVRAAKETLAVQGGSRAITYPDDKHGQASRWPLYRREEEEAVLKLIRNHSYAPIGLLERDWKAYTHAPYVKAFEKVWAHRKELA